MTKNIKNFNIGCAYTLGKNWLNYDSSIITYLLKFPITKILFKNLPQKSMTNILYGNIVKNPLCEENYANNIFLSHVLEHMTFIDAQCAIKNIFKMLKQGGCFRIVVPSLESRILKYIEDKNANDFMLSLGIADMNEKNLLKKMKFFFGYSRHRWMYDKNSLFQILKKNNFKNIRICKFNDSKEECFKEIEELSRFEEKDGKLPAVAFECTK